jgi:Transglycosylase SLT domain/D-alanyl-D-alanine carboxypeptidase/Putative Flp pilus-assembly TadE/G-like
VRRPGAHESGQAALPALALAVLVLFGAFGVFALGRAHLAAARAQRVADLAAISAARALVASLTRDLAATPDPQISFALARRAAEPSAAAAGAQIIAARIPEGPLPTSVEIDVAVPGPFGTTAHARARAGLLVTVSAAMGQTGWASGGGYSGPLVYRDGKPACPSVIAAFDLMDAAARGDGIDLVVVSGFRSDAEQAVLFANHPDPKWVAPPGRSRHREATELDLGMGGGAQQWLHDNATHFGFVQRYSWEAWHFGYLPGCSAAAATARRPAATRSDTLDTGHARGDRPLRTVAARTPAATALPAWVPEQYRQPVISAAVANGVPPVVLAALLQSESNWRPDARSPVGALGIAQFMPGTAAGMGLRDPLDPFQAIPAAGRLLGGHLRTFGRIELALAAYNAGPGAVQQYGGIPPYAETQGYVAKIMALAGGGAAVTVNPGSGIALLSTAEPL